MIFTSKLHLPTIGPLQKCNKRGSISTRSEGTTSQSRTTSALHEMLLTEMANQGPRHQPRPVDAQGERVGIAVNQQEGHYSNSKWETRIEMSKCYSWSYVATCRSPGHRREPQRWTVISAKRDKDKDDFKIPMSIACVCRLFSAEFSAAPVGVMCGFGA